MQGELKEKIIYVKLLVLDTCAQSAMAAEQWKKVELKVDAGSNTRIVKSVEVFSLNPANGETWLKTLPVGVTQVPSIIKSYNGLTEVYPSPIKPLEPISQAHLNRWINQPFYVNPL